MKMIKYRRLIAEESPNEEQIFLEKLMPWNEANEETAKREAYLGQYVIEEVEELEV